VNQYLINIFSLNGDHLITTELTSDKDAAIHVTDCINHTPGSKLRAAIVTKGTGHVPLETPIGIRQ